MFLNAISILKPKQVLIENVTSLISQAKGKALLKICNFFDENGYKHKFKVLQSAHYGVPQSRWRLIIIASKIKIPIMPEPTFRAKIVPNFSRGKELTFDTNWEDDLLFSLRNHTTVEDAISDLPELENGGTYVSQEYTNSPKTDLQKILRANNDKLTNHQTVSLGIKQISRVKCIHSPGMNWTDLPEDLIPNNLKKLSKKYGSGLGAKTRFGRLSWDGLFTTILTSADMYWGSFIHPEQDRIISTRESARAQTFPDYVQFKGTVTSQYRQIGNAVPCFMAKEIGKTLIGQIQHE